MAPPAATVADDEFDDDTEFDLPSAPPFGGPGGGQGFPGMPSLTPDQLAQFQSMMSGGGSGSGSGSGPLSMMGGGGGASGGPSDFAPQEEDAESHKWATIYPIYLDAKCAFRKGGRRTPYEKSVLWPKAQEMARAARELGLECRLQSLKKHPKDWANPGRIKVKLCDEEGKPLKSSIPTKHALLLALAGRIQAESGGAPPALPKQQSKSARRTAASQESKGASIASGGASKSSKGANKPSPISSSFKAQHVISSVSLRRSKLTYPPLTSRYPANSPALEVGMLNADMGSMFGGGGGGDGAGGGMGGLGSIMGSMGLGAGDSDDEDPPSNSTNQEGTKHQKKDPMANLNRKQKKRVVRMTK
ncbi:signal recognition particle, SRP19 subunit [Ceraceosorus guamensis]|uniref:Signal recognition particle, SRP19 subunit n=1 Tax=Ceraceosorus guamensis TaxID=1522189 RepID=A0A316VS86_9BASI|nr:signal recognition particle, SRP19 subunit [Ceraceosorus guamensis]PWN39273.1 signal recognition particle, SRP19 subunit [Ceraceosorus guamensis]